MVVKWSLITDEQATAAENPFIIYVKNVTKVHLTFFYYSWSFLVLGRFAQMSNVNKAEVSLFDVILPSAGQISKCKRSWFLILVTFKFCHRWCSSQFIFRLTLETPRTNLFWDFKVDLTFLNLLFWSNNDKQSWSKIKVKRKRTEKKL